MFLVLSISDMEMGLSSQTAIRMFSLCTRYISCGYSNDFLFVIVLFVFFPFTFSHILTTVTTGDRLFVITKQLLYEAFLIKRRLKVLQLLLLLYRLDVVLGLLIERVTQRCSVKRVFFEISENSQENSCARVSFLINLLA